jgi:hypothetical protein
MRDGPAVGFILCQTAEHMLAGLLPHVLDKPPRPDYTVIDNFVSGDYFRAMGMPILRGRALSESDNQANVSRVLVVDENVVRDLYPSEDPIGQHLSFAGKSWEIVGIVAPVRQFWLDRDPRPAIYIPQFYYPNATNMVIRTAQSPSSIVKSVREIIHEADPDQPIANVRTLEEAVHKSLATRRTTLVLCERYVKHRF